MDKEIEKESQLSIEEQTCAEELSTQVDNEIGGEENKEQESNKKSKFFDKKFVIVSSVITFLVAIMIFVNTVVLFMVVVSGGSMKPTLQGGEVLYVNKLVQPARGDIVIIKVFEKKPSNPSVMQEVWIIKRLIALPGDKVEIKNGYVFVNDQQLDEQYLAKQGVTDTLEWEGRILAEDEYFFLGDNRGVGQSSDSRDADKGACSREQILGVVTELSLKMQGVSKFFYNITSPIRKLVTRRG